MKVFELMPPLVDTDCSKEIGGANGIAPAAVASGLLAAIEKDEYEYMLVRQHRSMICTFLPRHRHWQLRMQANNIIAIQ